MDEVQDGLREAFGTDNRFTLPISGTGSAGMETLLSNLVEPGDRMVIGIHGVFGGRMRELAERLGAEVVAVEQEFGKALDEQAMVRAIQAGPTRLVGVVHAETSTGVLQPLDAIAAAARQAGALLLLDCVTSLGGAPVELDRHGVAAAFSGTQKCLSVPPGLSPCSFSDAALEKIRGRANKSPTWYFDVGLLDGYWGGDRAYHHTAPVSMVYALGESLRDMRVEGLAVRQARHREAAAGLYRGLEVLGLDCLVDPEVRTPMLTSVCIPEGVDDLKVRQRLRAEHAIEIGGGLGSLKGRVWRIGLMGYGARAPVVRRVLSALGAVLQSEGFGCDAAAAAAASQGE